MAVSHRCFTVALPATSLEVPPVHARFLPACHAAGMRAVAREGAVEAPRTGSPPDVSRVAPGEADVRPLFAGVRTIRRTALARIGRRRNPHNGPFRQPRGRSLVWAGPQWHPRRGGPRCVVARGGETLPRTTRPRSRPQDENSPRFVDHPDSGGEFSRACRSCLLPVCRYDLPAHVVVRLLRELPGAPDASAVGLTAARRRSEHGDPGEAVSRSSHSHTTQHVAPGRRAAGLSGAATGLLRGRRAGGAIESGARATALGLAGRILVAGYLRTGPVDVGSARR